MPTVDYKLCSQIGIFGDSGGTVTSTLTESGSCAHIIQKFMGVDDDGEVMQGYAVLRTLLSQPRMLPVPVRGVIVRPCPILSLVLTIIKATGFLLTCFLSLLS